MEWLKQRPFPTSQSLSMSLRPLHNLLRDARLSFGSKEEQVRSVRGGGEQGMGKALDVHIGGKYGPQTAMGPMRDKE